MTDIVKLREQFFFSIYRWKNAKNDKLVDI
jgi:hypothetical protein